MVCFMLYSYTLTEASTSQPQTSQPWHQLILCSCNPTCLHIFKLQKILRTQQKRNQRRKWQTWVNDGIIYRWCTGKTNAVKWHQTELWKKERRKDWKRIHLPVFSKAVCMAPTNCQMPSEQENLRPLISPITMEWPDWASMSTTPCNLDPTNPHQS